MSSSPSDVPKLVWLAESATRQKPMPFLGEQAVVAEEW